MIAEQTDNLFQDVEQSDDNWNVDDVNKKLYKHTKPLTLEKNTPILYTCNKKEKDNVVWKLYRQNLNNQTRTLLFEVENDIITLKITENGIYDIELYVYDEFGNLHYNDYQAILKIK